MKKYEYKYVVKVFFDEEKATKFLNDYGKDGWELVCVYHSSLYFKREIVNENEA